MAVVKINSQHHYVTLKVEFADKRRYNLTISHSGTRGTSSAPASLAAEDKAIFNRVFKAWDAATYTDKTPITGTVGERVAKLAEFAKSAATSTALAEAFETAIAGGMPPVVVSGFVAKPGSAKFKNAHAAKKAAAVATRPITVLITHKPEAGEGSGKFMQRLWMAGHNDPDALVALVLANYPSRTTTRSDVAYNVNQLRKQHGAANVPAWPK